MKKSMKKLLSIALCAFITSLNVSCADFLTETPQSYFEPNDAFKTEAGARAFVAGAYSCLSAQKYSYYAEYGSAIGVLGADLAVGTEANSIYGGFDVYRDIDSNDILENAWTSLYQTIANCNAIIDAIDICDTDEEIKDELRGHAYFLRAFSYFYLVRYWGDIPLLKHQSYDSDLGRTSVKEVYNLIVTDALSAIDVLPVSHSEGDVGMATRGTAKMLLAKVYMTMGGWPLKENRDMNYRLALQLLTDIKDNVDATYNYSLNEYYGDAFSLYNKNSKESLFEIQFSEEEQASRPQAIWSKNMGINTGGGVNYLNNVMASRRMVRPTLKLWRLWGEPANGVMHLDHRYNWNFADYRFASKDDGSQTTSDLNLSTTDSTYVGAIKYRYMEDAWDYLDKPYPFTRWQSSPNNYPVYRYADLLLMIAELENEINKGPTQLALDCVNMVRDRARNLRYTANGVEKDVVMPHAPNATTANSPAFEIIEAGVYDEASFFQLVFDERAKELCFEGHRWFDLARTEQLYDAVVDRGISMPADIYYPIPLVDTNIDTSL